MLREALIRTIDNHKKWVEAAKRLGCHSIRVNSHGEGNDDAEKAAITDSQKKVRRQQILKRGSIPEFVPLKEPYELYKVLTEANLKNKILE